VEPGPGSLVEICLRARVIDPAVVGGNPIAPRFRAAVDYREPEGPDSNPVKLGAYPTMVARMSGVDGRFLGAHVIYPLPDGSGKIRLPDPDRPGHLLPARKVFGHATGGTIPLAKAAPPMQAGEGIKTSLSGMVLEPGRPAWAFIALALLKETFLPPTVRDVTILGDNDMKPPKPGEKDSKELLVEGAQTLQAQAAGRTVRIAWAPPGMDFNDVLTTGRGPG
jgi:hypothetical protein